MKEKIKKTEQTKKMKASIVWSPNFQSIGCTIYEDASE